VFLFREIWNENQCLRERRRIREGRPRTRSGTGRFEFFIRRMGSALPSLHRVQDQLARSDADAFVIGLVAVVP